MKALVKTGKGKGMLHLKDLPIPQPDPGEVLVKIGAAGICGTDIHILHDEFTYYPPVVLGHEFSGKIVGLGEGVEGWREGDRVVCEPHSGACGICDLCRSGFSQICSEKRSPGWGRDGAFAEYAKLPTSMLHRIPQNVSDRSAAVAEPLAIVLHETVERGGIQAGDQVVIFGAGPIGLLAAAVARISGASQIILVGTEMDTVCRFNIAMQIPVDAIINASREDVVERVRSITGERFADLTIEASGSPEAIAQTVQVIRKLGKISAVGLPGNKPVHFPWQDAMSKVVDLHFNLSSSHSSWIRAVAVMGAERIDPGFIVTHEFPLERWEEAFYIAETGSGAKVLLIPQ